MKHQRVCLVGMFPPPLHGMSLINEFVRKRISLDDSPIVIDFSPRNLNRSLLIRSGKIFRVASALLKLLSSLLLGRAGPVYFGLSGGSGQIYDALFVGIARLFGRNIYLHHHSYQYINRARWIAKLLFSIAGKDAIHIVACEKMAGDLQNMYPVVTRVRIISGIVALEHWDSEVRSRSEIKSVGFISNISIEKGILEFLDVADKAANENLPLQFILAGPFHDDEVKNLVEARLEKISNVTCIGAVYSSDKFAFFDSIDVLLMPSHNESEGLVIHESMSRGVPVIAYSRGCIEQIISEQVGLKFAPEDDYVLGAVAKLKEWLLSPRAFQLTSHAAVDHFIKARAKHAAAIDELCIELICGNRK